MNLQDVRKTEDALQSRLRPWVAKASLAIRGKVEDARAHAGRALTAGIKQAQDGQASRRKILASRSYVAALNRLDELQVMLIGDRVDSLQGLIRDARADFYRFSIDLWKPHIRPKYLVVPNPGPTKEGDAIVRRAIVDGATLLNDIGPTIDQSKRSLEISMNSAARKDLRASVAQDLLDTWESDSVRRIEMRVFGSLSDSNSLIHELVGLMLIAEPYRASVLPTAASL